MPRPDALPPAACCSWGGTWRTWRRPSTAQPHGACWAPVPAQRCSSCCRAAGTCWWLMTPGHPTSPCCASSRSTRCPSAPNLAVRAGLGAALCPHLLPDPALCSPRHCPRPGQHPGVLLLPRHHLLRRRLLHPEQRAGKCRLHPRIPCRPRSALPSPQVALETTIGNSDEARWRYLRPQGSVLEWLRNIVANRLARSGAEWASIFQRFNSGT